VAEDLKTQAAFSKQIKDNLATINSQLGDQIKLQNLVNLSLKGQLDEAAKAGNIADDAMKKAGVSAAGTAGSIGTATTALKENEKAAIAAGSAGTGLGAKMVGAAEATMGAWDATARAIDGMIVKPVSQELDIVQTLYGGLSGPGGPFAATNDQARRLVDTTMGIGDQLTDMNGKWAQAFGKDPRRVLGELTEVYGDFNQMISKDQGMVDGLKIVRDFTADTVMEMKAYSKAANLDMTDVQNVVSRQISRTGKAGTEMLKNIAVLSKKVAGATGDSAKMIAQNIVKIIDDTDKFGNVTEFQAARISANLRQLGLGYEDLSGAVGKFTDFEGAADSVSKLTTVFGVQMDAMEMMTLANEDQEMFLRRMREQMLSTGKAVDDMTLAEKRLIKESLGLQKIESVERLLDPSATISSLGDLTAVTQKGAGDMHEDMALLKDDIVSLEGAMRYTSEAMADHIKETGLMKMQKEVIEIDHSMGKMGATFERAIPKTAGMSMKFFGKGLSDIVGIDEQKLKDIKTFMGGIADELIRAGDAAKNSDVGEVLKGIAKSSGLGDDMKEVTGGLSKAAEDMAKTFSDAIDGIIAKLKEKGLLQESPYSRIGRNMGEGMSNAWEMGFDNMTATQLRFGKVSEKQIELQKKRAKTNMKYRAKIEKKYYNKISKDRDKAIAEEKKAEKDYQKIKQQIIKEGRTKENHALIIKAQKGRLAARDNLKTAQKEVKTMEDMISGKTKKDLKQTSKFEEAKARMIKAGAKRNKLIDNQNLRNKLDANEKIIESQKKTVQYTTLSEQAMTKDRLKMIRKESDDRKSYYGQQATALGKTGKSFEQLTAKEKKEYAERLNLGKDYEKELSAIMKSKSFREGKDMKKRQGAAKDFLQEQLAAGKKFGDLSESTLATLKKEYGLDDDMVKKALEGGGNLDEIVSGGSDVRMKEIEKKEKKDDTKEGGKSRSGSSGAVSRASRAQVAKLQELSDVTSLNGEAILEVHSAIAGLHETLKEKNYSPQIDVTLDGKSIVKYIATNPVSDRGTVQVK